MSSSAILGESAATAGSNLLSFLLPGWRWTFVDDRLEVRYSDGKLSWLLETRRDFSSCCHFATSGTSRRTGHQATLPYHMPP